MPSPAPRIRLLPDDLLPWASRAAGWPQGDCRLDPVTGDASNRRYFRLSCADGPGGAPGKRGSATASAVVMEAPPATEKNGAFVAVHRLLQEHGVRVPHLLAADLERGYLLLEDLGDRQLLPLLDACSVGCWYQRARAVLLAIARIAPAGVVPDYDWTLLAEELGRLPEWFFARLLGLSLGEQERRLLAELGDCLLDSALTQPRVLVHRDFHSRNLMVLEDDELALIDFQDAVFGPITYDLVSLLRDCYIRWPREQVEIWALEQRDALQVAGLLGPVADAAFLRWFDLMGLQRHLKVLGTFARLYLRDGKAGYLADLPLVACYVEEVLGQRGEEPVLARFQHWWQVVVRPAIDRQDWARA
ncbi:MAG: aminoglycoside phosphotransferase family protein [Parahaliea sp.]